MIDDDVAPSTSSQLAARSPGTDRRRSPSPTGASSARRWTATGCARPVPRHRGRPRGDGIRGRRARSPRGAHRQEVAARAGRLLLVDTAPAGFSIDAAVRARSARRSHTASGSAPAPCTLDELDPRTTCRRRTRERLLVRQQAFGYSVEDVESAAASRWASRRGGGRVDGQRHAARGAQRPAAAALQLFQAAVRAGHQPADRSHSRAGGDVAGDRHSAPEGTSSSRGPRRRSGSRCRIPCSPTTTSRSCGTSPSASSAADDLDGLPPRRRCGRAGRRASSASAALASKEIEAGATVAHSQRPAHRCIARARFHRSSPPLRCTTTWSASRHAPAWAWSSRPARRARSMHLALLIGYGAEAVNPYLAFETIADIARRD